MIKKNNKAEIFLGFLERKMRSFPRTLNITEETILWLLNERGCLSTETIRNEMKVKSDTLSHSFSFLQNFKKMGKEKALIKRKINFEDARKTDVYITSMSKKILLQNSKMRAKYFLRKLTDKDRESFLFLAEKMI